MNSRAILILLLFSAFTLPAENMNSSSLLLTSGITVDVAPFGIEQVYFTLKGAWVYEGPALFGVMPSFSVNPSSRMLRVPFVVGFSGYTGRNRKISVSGYAGGGAEVYSSGSEIVISPLAACGIIVKTGIFVLDIPVVTAFRYFNTDSDIGITVGFSIPVLRNSN